MGTIVKPFEYPMMLHTYEPAAIVYARAAQGRDFRYTTHRTWPRQAACDGVRDLGEVLYYGHGVHESSVVIQCEQVVYEFTVRSHYLTVRAAAAALDTAVTALDDAQSRWPNDIVATVEQEIPVKFWFNSSRGPQSWTRNIVVPTWEEIAGNYPKADAVHSLVQWGAPPAEASGKLMLWFGKPGVGKTYAVRCLGWEWRDWCSLEYITDPDAFFGDASYMMQALIQGMDDDPTSSTKSTAKYRMLICEDVGELMVADAKQRTGQALSRLLNLSEGLIGQGMNLIVLLTTNEELTSLHPAVRRPGRSLVNLDFPGFTYDGAREWLAAHNADLPERLSSPTLADLYSIAARHNVEQKVHQLETVGFRR